MASGRDRKTQSELESFSDDPEILAKQMLSPWTGYDPEDYTNPVVARCEFERIRRTNGLEVAKELIDNWEEWTLPGDPYPIPTEEEKQWYIQQNQNVTRKGRHRFLTDTSDPDWIDKLIAKVDERIAEDQDTAGQG